MASQRLAIVNVLAVVFFGFLIYIFASEQAYFQSVDLFRRADHLGPRTLQPPARGHVPGPLEQIYRNLEPTDNFVPSGGAKAWLLRMGTHEYTTAEFFGCTIVILMGDEGIGIMHAREYCPGGKGDNRPLSSASDAEKYVYKPEQPGGVDELLADIGLCTQRAIVIGVADRNAAGVRWLLRKLEEQHNPAKYVKYEPRMGSMGSNYVLEGPFGKAAVRVTKNANGVTFDVFYQSDIPTFTLILNANGDVVQDIV